MTAISKVPRLGARHKLGSLYDWLDANIGAGGSSGPALPTGTADGQGIAWDNTAKSWGLVGIKQTMSYQISETDLLAHTTQHLILHPGQGFTNSIVFMMIAVQKTLTTGGTIKMQNGGVDITNLTATLSNGATAGTHSIKGPPPDATKDFGFGDDITLVLSGFATAGALNVFIATAGSP